ncbi:MAG: sensor domain-containing diguanylate cyclase [bacterium]|nr:sensor domain-containing diguanylate cyclase [Gammaproteobacteria bacterium]HIL97314.1 sensor domain-containing diguanylate cyclase [Pseudomonadales bacterium]
MKIDSGAYRRLIDIGLALSAEKHIDSLLERILMEAKTLTNADAGTVYLATGQASLSFAIVINDTLNISQSGNVGASTLPDVPLVNSDGEHNMGTIAARSANLGETIVIEDIYLESSINGSATRKFDELTGYKSKSFLTVPLRNSLEETIGVLQLLNAKSTSGKVVPFSSAVIPLVEALASQASVALENRNLLDEQVELRKQLEVEVDERTAQLKQALDKLTQAHVILKDLTTIDPVTSIRNRQYFDQSFEQEWRRALRQRYPVTLILIDIDHFKVVNDSHGHLAGDECLAAVAGAVEGMFHRPSDIVARYGGEEFVVILPYIEADNAHQMAEQVRVHVENLEIDADGHKIGVTISLGHATVIPTEKLLSRDLISQADKAMYKAKSLGRNRVVAWTEIESKTA